MKKGHLFLLVCGFLFSAITIHAQISAGAGVAVGTQVTGAGLQIRLAYDLDSPIRPSIDMIRYFGNSKIFFNDITEWNGNIHYKLIDKETHSVYGLAGFHLTRTRESLVIRGVTFSATQSYIGWNIGAGSQFEVAEQIHIVGEVKYIAGDAQQWVLALGGIYSF